MTSSSPRRAGWRGFRRRRRRLRSPRRAVASIGTRTGARDRLPRPWRAPPRSRYCRRRRAGGQPVDEGRGRRTARRARGEPDLRARSCWGTWPAAAAARRRPGRPRSGSRRRSTMPRASTASAAERSDSRPSTRRSVNRPLAADQHARRRQPLELAVQEGRRRGPAGEADIGPLSMPQPKLGGAPPRNVELRGAVPARPACRRRRRSSPIGRRRAEHRAGDAVRRRAHRRASRSKRSRSGSASRRSGSRSPPSRMPTSSATSARPLADLGLADQAADPLARRSRAARSEPADVEPADMDVEAGQQRPRLARRDRAAAAGGG